MTTLPRAILFDLDETILTFGPRLEQLVAVAADFIQQQPFTAVLVALVAGYVWGEIS